MCVCSNTRVHRPGMWSRTAIMNEGLDQGSVFPYLDRAIKRGYDFIVLNPNENQFFTEDGDLVVRVQLLFFTGNTFFVTLR